MRLIKRLKSRTVRGIHRGLDAARDVRSACRVAVRSRTATPIPSDRPRILIVDAKLPDPRFGAGFPRAAEIVQVLATSGWEVTMYPLSATRTQYADVRARFGADVTFVKSLGEKGLRRLLREHIGHFDTVLVSRPDTMEAYVRQLPAAPSFASATHCVYDAEAIFAIRTRARRQLFGEPMSDEDYHAALSEELSLLRDAHAVIAVTTAEAQILTAATDVPTHVVGHSIAPRPDAPDFSRRHDFLFVGSLYGERKTSPNVDSLIWFVEEIMPLIDRQIGSDYRLIVAGLAAPAVIARLGSDRIVFMGVVDDLGDLYDSCRVFIAPTRFAAGMPQKVGEAAAMGIPCVATTLIANQLEFDHGKEIFSGSDATSFSTHCVHLYTEPAVWSSVREAAQRKAAIDYSPTSFASAIVKAVTPPPRPSRQAGSTRRLRKARRG